MASILMGKHYLWGVGGYVSFSVGKKNTQWLRFNLVAIAFQLLAETYFYIHATLGAQNPIQPCVCVQSTNAHL